MRERRPRSKAICALKMLTGVTLIAACLLRSTASAADQPGGTLPNPLSIAESIDYALAHHPAVRAKLEQAAAATEGVAVAQRAYLPRADLLWQVNIATRNNIFGLLLPQSIVPPVSGPVLPASSSRGALGSAAGALVSWEPLDFGYRGANTTNAQSARDRADAELSLTRLDVAAAAAASFLTLAAAQQAALAAQADVERRRIFAASVRALAGQGLRPGADASRADAELAAAEIRLIQTTQSVRTSEAELAQRLGAAGAAVQIDASALVARLPAAPPLSEIAAAEPSRSAQAHPAALAAAATLSEARAREAAVAASYYPRILVQASLSARGSGANPDGSFSGEGLGFQRLNWAVGLTITLSALDFLTLGPKGELEAALARAMQAQLQQEIQDVTGGLERARAVAEGASLIAQRTPIELSAARQNEAQARSRYESGLATVVEVAEAQRLLLQAETDDRMARLAVWRASLAQAHAQGSLKSFLDLLPSRAVGEP